MARGKSSKLIGGGVGNFPAPGEKRKIEKLSKIVGTGPGVGTVTDKGKLTASYDNTPRVGDNKPGATRPGK